MRILSLMETMNEEQERNLTILEASSPEDSSPLIDGKQGSQLPTNLILGPTTESERFAITAMNELNIPENERPKRLRDSVVKRSKKGPAGMIMVKRVEGVVNNTAKQLVKQFESNTAGRDDIIEKLEAAKGEGVLSEGDQRLLVLMRAAPRSKSLAHLIADAKTEPLGVMKAYAKGCVVLGQVQAAIEAHSRLPALAKDIFRHALDRVVECGVCVGSGRVATRPSSSTVTMESKRCTACHGEGSTTVVSDHKQWAAKAALEMTGQIKSPGSTNVNVQQNVAVAPGSAVGFMERILQASDKILYNKVDVVEAEILRVQ
jgi:hypothetical protein